MKLKLILLSLLLICCAVGTANAQGAIDKEKEQQIRRLLELTEAGNMGRQVIELSLVQMKASFATLPADVVDKVMRVYEEEMLKDFSGDKMVEAVIPIYDKYLSLDEIKQLITIYESPIGRKLVTVLPQIGREAFDVGTSRARLTVQRILARLEADGLLNPPASAEPKKQPSKNSTPRRGRRKP